MDQETSLLARVDHYIETLFVPPDAALAANLQAADAGGLPSIQVSPSQGKLLYLLVKIAQARRVLEIGTLGGYSTTWLARALPPGGRLVSLELVEHHAQVARASVAHGAPGVDVEVRVGSAASTLRALIAAGEPPFDVVFIDADKPGYETYLALALELSRPGTLILADNVIRNGLVMDEAPADPNARAARAFNQALASHPRLESLILPIVRQYVDGLAISVVTS
jgi:caffeoyl-CoA O-methyltransferase